MGQHIVLDFDGTITEEDTIGNIAHAALEWRKTPEGGGMDLAAHWQRIVQSYTQDLAAYDQTQPSEQQRTTWQQELAYLRGRSVVEEASLARVRESGIFQGFAADNRLFEAGRRHRETGRTRIRDGFADYIAMVTARKDIVHVVSVNWSASYIRGVLEPWAVTSIIANDIQLDGAISAPLGLQSGILSSDGLPKAIATSSDKLKATQKLLRRTGGRCMGYFGDSATDIECLRLYGGCAIALDGQSTLSRALRRLGYDLPYISKPQSASAHISWAHNFTEIAAQAEK